MKKKLISFKDNTLKLFQMVFQSIGRFISKVGYGLTHNRVLYLTHNEIKIFKKISIKMTNKRREIFYGYLFIGIWVIGFLWLTFYPLLMSFVYSLNQVTITGSEGIKLTFYGFKYYIDIFTGDLDFMLYLQGFIGQIVLYVPVILIISMIIAMLLNQKIRFRGVFRSIFFLPVIIASGPVIGELMNQGAGTIPMIEESGLAGMLADHLPKFIAAPISQLFSEMIIVLWFSGVQIVLFLAGLQKINKEVYEAASIDGASPWESFWKITLPALKSIILVSAIYTIVMLATFSTNNIIRHIQKLMFDTSKGYGYSSALAWIYFVVIAVILGITAIVISFRREPADQSHRWRRGR